MGKSEKKKKSNRINALRKQFDEFLENERKRKERNEYILGKLEKMRFSDSLVAKPTTAYLEVSNVKSSAPNPLDGYAVQHRLQPVSSIQNKSSVCLIPKATKESLVLKELSKKYILIPKLTTIPVDDNANELFEKNINNDVSPSFISNDNTDWKSKYEILKKLKKYEKEGITEPVKDISPKYDAFGKSYEYTLDITTGIPKEESLTKGKLQDDLNIKETEDNKRYNTSKTNSSILREEQQPLTNNLYRESKQNADFGIHQYETSIHDLEKKAISKKDNDITPEKLNNRESTGIRKEVSDYQKNMKSKEIITSANLKHQNTKNISHEDQNYTDQTIAVNSKDKFKNVDSSYGELKSYKEQIKDINQVTTFDLPLENKKLSIEHNDNEFDEQNKQLATNNIDSSAVDAYDTQTNNTEISDQINQLSVDSTYQYDHESTKNIVDESFPTVENDYDSRITDNVNEINNESKENVQYENEAARNSEVEMNQNITNRSFVMQPTYQYDVETPITASEYAAEVSYAQNSDGNNESGGLVYAEPKTGYNEQNSTDINEIQNQNDYQYDANGQYQYYEGEGQYAVEGNEDPNYVQQYDGDYNYNQPVYAESNQPEHTENQPEYAENQPLYAENNQPEYVENQSEYAENQLEYAENQPEYAENQPVYAENNQPEYVENQSEYAENQLEYAENQPEYAENQPEYTGKDQPVYAENQPKYAGNDQPVYAENQPVHAENQPVHAENHPEYAENQPEYAGKDQPVYAENQPKYAGNDQPVYAENQPEYAGNNQPVYAENQPECAENI